MIATILSLGIAIVSWVLFYEILVKRVEIDVFNYRLTDSEFFSVFPLGIAAHFSAVFLHRAFDINYELTFFFFIIAPLAWLIGDIVRTERNRKYSSPPDQV